VNSSKRIME